jgi:APA family basic amino acid/polyamine antiporter
MSEAPSRRLLGFWSCWALVVGTMIGSGVFLLPTTLAPFGLMAYGGFFLAGAGALSIGLVFARLAARTTRSGGPYIYVQDAFGGLLAFLNAWALWVSYWITIPILAVAFVGYLTIFSPSLHDAPLAQALAALALTWTLTLISMRGLREASFVQILMTLLKIVPLLLVAALACVFGRPANLPALDPTHAPPIATIAATTLLALWPFTGLEAGVIPAGNVDNPQRAIPRAVVTGVITAGLIYFIATFAVMLLVPAHALAGSAAPFADAARALGPWGAPLIAAGALVAIIGTLNGVLFCCGQLPMAVALDGLAPAALAKLNRGQSPYISLLLSAVLGSILLLANYTRGLVQAYTFLVTMATMVTLFPYLFSALAELKHSWRSARGWAIVALFASLYSLFAAFGSGWEALWQGALLTLVGVPVFYLGRRRKAALTPAS